MIEITVTVIGILAGVIGFLLTNFYFQPVLRYREIIDQVTSDLVFYANAIRAQGLNDEMRQRVFDRMTANRRHSVDLAACFYRLPREYEWYLRRTGEDPANASIELMGFSNTDEFDAADIRMKKIQAYLGIKPPIV